MFFASKRLGALEDAIGTLDRRLVHLENDRKAHLLELEEMYEKLGRLYGRIRKRQERAIQEEDASIPEDSPCHDPITAAVLKRREARTDVLGKS